LEGQLAVHSFEFLLSFLNLVRKLPSWEEGFCCIGEERRGFACACVCGIASEVSTVRSLSGGSATAVDSWLYDALAFSSTPVTSHHNLLEGPDNLPFSETVRAAGSGK